VADKPSSDERDPTLVQGAPEDATCNPSRQAHDQDSVAMPPEQPGNEEPALVQEADLPSDGRDEVGEAMIRNLPQRPELSEPAQSA
jgi:hypothetical protein